ncbi:hypothetical protein NDU88_011126, partial [Pleurodeles waltl]
CLTEYALTRVFTVTAQQRGTVLAWPMGAVSQTLQCSLPHSPTEYVLTRVFTVTVQWRHRPCIALGC